MPTDQCRTATSGVVYRASDGESLSEAVVRAVADRSDVDPVPDTDRDVDRTLDPLYTVVDPDALDQLFRQTDSGGARPSDRVTFTYHGYAVTVRSGGTIHLVPADAPVEGAAD